MDIGQKLKQKRKSLSKTLDDIHDQTRISIEYLTFLEASDFSFLPETYVKSFLRDYSNALGLEAEEVLESLTAELRIREEADGVGKRNMASVPRPSSRVLEWSLILGAIVLTISIAFTYAQHRSQRSSPNDFNTATFSPAVISSGAGAAPFELRIANPENVTVRIFIGDEEFIERTLSADQNILKIVDGEFDVLIRNASDLPFNIGREDLGKIMDSGKPIRLVFSRKVNRR